ncbi:uncharacterized protein LOC133900060 [Phragmites australis]|uniref:uncharacterized protein LOC133900060 n=1 Tax=Phragmites australis TaxID=29695 RepID=UPI002D782B40|nr:uncharacterized protein LOC133900060 [Phragmites australis]
MFGVAIALVPLSPPIFRARVPCEDASKEALAPLKARGYKVLVMLTPKQTAEFNLFQLAGNMICALDVAVLVPGQVMISISKWPSGFRLMKKYLVQTADQISSSIKLCQNFAMQIFGMLRTSIVCGLSLARLPHGGSVGFPHAQNVRG